MKQWTKDLYYDYIEGPLQILFVLTIVIGIMAGAVAGTVYGLGRPACFARTQDIQLPVRWSFWGNCQIEIEVGRWIPLENYRWFENAP